MDTLIFLVFVPAIFCENTVVGAWSEPARRIQTGPAPPCLVENSFLFAREDVPPGTTLMKLPTVAGESWALMEGEPAGFLSIDSSSGGHCSLVFSKSPDLETISQLSGRRRQSLTFVLVCTFQEWIYKYQQELIVSDVNEHSPSFDPDRSYSFNLSEATSVGSSTFNLRQAAIDLDTTGQVAFYSLEPYVEPQVDGRHYFQIADDGNHVVLSHPLDYEALQREGGAALKLNLSATDNGSPTALSSFVTLTVHVIDEDDQGPAFVYPECPRLGHFCRLPYFQTAVKCGFRGQPRLYPGPILAVDRDTQNYSILYSISRVEPDTFTDNVEINERTGEIQIDATPCSLSMQELVLTVTATENSTLQHSTSTNIQVKLLDNLAVSNMAWNLQVGGDQTSSRSSSLPLVAFLVVVLAFIIVGTVLAFLAVRISHNKKHNKVQSGPIARATLELNECHLYHGGLHKVPSCFQSCAYNCSPQLSHSSAGCDSLPASLTLRDAPSLDTLSLPTADHSESREMWTAFTTASSNPFLADISFSPSPALPGRADLTSFYDPNSSLGSMKHERTVEGSRQVGKLTLNSVIPDCVKYVAQKVRFDTSSFNQSSV